MKGLVHISHMLVDPVNGKGILNKIIGSNAEEIHMLGQDLGHSNCRWYLDHNAHFYVTVIFDVFAIQLVLHLAHNLFGIQKLLQPGYHREH